MVTSKHTTKQLEDAASDARQLVVDSGVIRAAVTNMIISRQLYIASRQLLENELTHGWEVQNREIVADILVRSAQDKATEPFQFADLLKSLTQTTLPFVDILAMQHASATEPAIADTGKEQDANVECK